MSHTTPEDGEIWQDQEGSLLVIVGDGKRARTFGGGHELWIEHLEPVDQPSKRVFDKEGAYVGDGQLDRPVWLDPEGMTSAEAERLEAELHARSHRYYDRLRAAGLAGREPPHVEAHIFEMTPDGGLREVTPDAMSGGPDPRTAQMPESLREALAFMSDTPYEPGDQPNRLG